MKLSDDDMEDSQTKVSHVFLFMDDISNLVADTYFLQTEPLRKKEKLVEVDNNLCSL